MFTQSAIAAVAAFSALAAASPTPPRLQSNRAVIRNTTGNINAETGTVSSSNWGGIVAAPPSGQSFTTIVGTYSQPSCSNPNDGTTGPWTVAGWIGIDGVSPSPSLLQAGSLCTANTDGSVSYAAWVEFLPAGLVTVDGFELNENDEFTISIAVQDPSTGVITLQAAGRDVFTTTLTAPEATGTIQGISAEWIVEDISANGGYVPFPNYNTYNWNGAYAVATGGGQVAALDLDYQTWNLDLDDGAGRDGTQVTFTTSAGDDAFNVANSG